MMVQKMRALTAALLWIGITAQAQCATPSVGTLNLVCSGGAEKTEYTISEQVRSQEGDVRLYLTGNEGTADIPRFIGGAKEGRQTVQISSVTDNMIIGKINYQAFGNAKMRIDRLAGTIAITGPRGNFSGRCQPFDPAKATPKF